MMCLIGAPGAQDLVKETYPVTVILARKLH